ncbi:DUF4376 domain-containing protein [Halomonas glaciei]|uniref:DUF4376 domain-containing protein n=1 Tax=Vreelandella glaciei TaxID=186761 RepID=A0A7Z0LX02_9GAMM|nr:DUF4376 domain-containing protein [Halomonas glaciei]NYS80153.1 DUF4376 domain-containing protein [Halomonas glaciei]
MYYSPSRNAFYHHALEPIYKQAGTWPADAIAVSDAEWVTYTQGDPPQGMQRGGDENGRPAWVPIPPARIEALANRKRREIEAARDAAINAGFTHTFGDTEDVVQTRQRDRENLTGLAVSAQRHAAETYYFRAQSNATYELTASEMLALADAAQTHVSQQYAHSWQLKAEIDTALEAEDRPAIEAINW